MSQPAPRETPPPSLDPDGLPPLFDTGNILLAKVQSNLVIGKVPTPAGEMGVATIRTSCITVTLLLDKAEATDWASTFAELAKSLSGSSLIIPVRGQAQRIADAARAAGNGQQG